MAETNPNARLEAFSDGVFAFALTLLIVDIKIPSSARIETTNDFWLALSHIIPSVYAFLLSFFIILITWVNHHGHVKLLNKTSASFIYANGLLLLTVVFIPFPTALLGDYLFTDHSSPAVVLYNVVLALQAISWIFVSRVALKNQLARNEKSALTILEHAKYGYLALTIYSLCAIVAFWFPLAIAITTTLIWIFWLIVSIRTKYE